MPCKYRVGRGRYWKNSPEAAGVGKGRQQKTSCGDRNKQEDTQTKVAPESEKK